MKQPPCEGVRQIRPHVSEKIGKFSQHLSIEGGIHSNSRRYWIYNSILNSNQMNIYHKWVLSTLVCVSVGSSTSLSSLSSIPVTAATRHFIGTPASIRAIHEALIQHDNRWLFNVRSIMYIHNEGFKPEVYYIPAHEVCQPAVTMALYSKCAHAQ